MGADAGTPLVRLLLQASGDVRVSEADRVFARDALAGLGDLAVPLLAPLLTHAHPQVRADAAWALSRRPTMKARDSLLAGTRNPDQMVRLYCTAGLTVLKDATLAPAFLELTRDPFSEVRIRAVEGLSGIYDPQFRSRLASVAWRDPSATARDTAATALMSAPDRLAQRLGRRYRPFDTAPVLRDATTLVYLAAFSLTAALLGLIGAASLFSPTPDLSYLRVAAGGLASALVGAIWGGRLLSLSMGVEIALLVGALPCTAAVGWAVLRGRDGPVPARRRAWLGLIGASYVGFALGWLWLWGVFGV